MKPPIRILISMLGFAACGPMPGGDRPVKYLVLDSRTIEGTENVALRLGHVVKHPANPLFREDRPWELRFDNLYPNVQFDPERRLYRCWYSPFIVDPEVAGSTAAERENRRYRPHDREMGVCYAESRDGLRWTKPELGLVEFEGDSRNNLVVRGPHGAGVLFDPQDADPARRFKMFCRVSDRAKTMGVAFSRDGLRWSDPLPCPEIQVPGDTHNNALRLGKDGGYVGITRMKSDQRLVARTESADFVHWTRAVEVLRGDKLHQTYAMPVFRHAGVHLGFVMVFDTAADRVSCELAWSPDTVVWNRIEPGRALIPNSEKRGDYDWGCVYASVPVFTEREVRIYYGASNGPHSGWRDGFFALATLRPDGFAGYSTDVTGKTGHVDTKPVVCAGKKLCVSVDAPDGELRVAVLGDERLGTEACRPVTGRVTDGVVSWADGADLGRHVGREIRLRFELKDATLYAFGFEP